ncbi:acetyl-CoA carboxylase biotin carboxyl carrier protein subunit [Paucibacter sp. PLA-PC-4]|uniref:acetyl-CoA carboxylase biotin carboxyl carrier protein subunit n=1 Tax=Paucibacter sp. PLA-PC-4 TaxID=2993655 RepID=UPI0022494A36|nr:acetyl-CoA carboxylase biotin carboxyl carrier protein subunit [Paucibacter sp. PLA-PC-4]MCX2860378.1 acetyl-CoA carboxylase biotin carboxyl carrier protein subunit [Paucibacter sp. PLA-PC-4]
MSEVSITSEASGSVWKIEVTPGQQVAEGETLLVIESMKMELPLAAPATGTVARILVSEGEMVEEEQPLLVLTTQS